MMPDLEQDNDRDPQAVREPPLVDDTCDCPACRSDMSLLVQCMREDAE